MSSLSHQPKISTKHWKFLCNNEAVLISVYTLIKLLTLELGVPKTQWIILVYCFVWVTKFKCLKHIWNHKGSHQAIKVSNNYRDTCIQGNFIESIIFSIGIDILFQTSSILFWQLFFNK